MGILDFIFGKDEEEETVNEADEDVAPSTDDNDDDEDSALADAIDGAASLNEDDWFAAEQHAGYVAIAEAAVASKQAKATRRAQAEAARLKEETRVAKLAQKKAWDDEQAARHKRDKEKWEAENEAKAGGAAKAVEQAVKTTKPASTHQLTGQPAGIAPQPDAAERAAATRLANAQAAKIEAEAALLKAQAQAAFKAAAAGLAAPAPAGATGTRNAAAERAPRKTSGATPRREPASVGLAEIEGYIEADRLALASVGHWPPTPQNHRGAFWTLSDDWPATWTLSGGDLGRFRAETNLTRAVFAAQLGVPSAVVKDAEMTPREKVGPALQIALRRAMDHEAEVRQRRREERAAARTGALPSDQIVPAEAPVATTAASGGAETAPAGAATFTGADLAGLRAERRLSQREMADLLEVEQGTISKGEGKAGAAVGPALQEALGRLAARGGTVMPE